MTDLVFTPRMISTPSGVRLRTAVFEAPSDTPRRGVWRDKLQPDGRFIDESAPATSFYHLMMAILELTAQTSLKGPA